MDSPPDYASDWSPPGYIMDWSSLEIRSAAFRRFKSLPRPFNDLDDSPAKSSVASPSSSPRSFGTGCLIQNVPSASSGEKCNQSTTSLENNRFSLHEDEESSQDSGLGLDKAQSPFAKPHAPAPRPPVPRLRILGDSTNIINSVSPKPRHSPTPDFTQHFKGNQLKENSPTKLRKSSLTCSPETDEGDDGFLDLSDGDEGDIPKGLEGLLLNPVLPTSSSGCSKYHPLEESSVFTPCLSTCNQENIRPKKSLSRRGLFRSPSTPARISDQRSPLCTLTTRNKTQHHDDSDTNILYKKRKSVTGHSENELNKADKLPRCSSEALIISALDFYDVDNIIGDFSKPYCLPTIVGSHCDLKCITPDTLAQVIEGQYSDVVEKFTIIDCRYPYEYEGGHIKNAVNIWEKDSMIQFQKSGQNPNSSSKRSIIIFHCEFSSERAPKMSRFLREIDRAANKECYPSLGFPELYTLEGGYKAFYAKHKELCEPQTYKPMLHENHIQDLRHFRAKSKSWAGERELKASFRSNKLASL